MDAARYRARSKGAEGRRASLAAWPIFPTLAHTSPWAPGRDCEPLQDWRAKRSKLELSFDAPTSTAVRPGSAKFAAAEANYGPPAAQQTPKGGCSLCVRSPAHGTVAADRLRCLAALVCADSTVFSRGGSRRNSCSAPPRQGRGLPVGVGRPRPWPTAQIAATTKCAASLIGLGYSPATPAGDPARYWRTPRGYTLHPVPGGESPRGGWRPCSTFRPDQAAHRACDRQPALCSIEPPPRRGHGTQLRRCKRPRPPLPG